MDFVVKTVDLDFKPEDAVLGATTDGWLKSKRPSSRCYFIGAGPAVGANMLLGRMGKAESLASFTHVSSVQQEPPVLLSRIFTSPLHKAHYWEAGPAEGPLMILVHGWPEFGLLWRAQMEFFAARGWRCVAPDMRGYGGSSAPTVPEAYALSEIIQDMVELHDHLGAKPAIWVGHDLGSPVIGSLAAHHAKRSRGVVLVSVPYSPDAFALPSLLPLVDRKLYPADQYPDDRGTITASI